MTMFTEKSHFNQEFAKRLRQALLAKGYCSSRSPSGVNMQRFARMTGYSVQICRKYLRGEAIPELTKLLEIAEQLEVSPGWLLFGNSHGQQAIEPHKITINKELLHYIYFHVSALHHPEDPLIASHSDFFVHLSEKVSHMSDDTIQSKNIVDLAINSAKHFVTREPLNET